MASFGERLKREREKRNFTLDDVSATTKISTRMLRALEDEHFNQLPGGIFNKGFVRAYARHLALDEEELVAEYLEATGELSSKAAPGPGAFPLEIHESKAPSSSTADRVPWAAFALVLLVAAVALAAWGVYSRGKRTASHPASSNSDKASPVSANLHPASTATSVPPAAPSAAQPAPASTDTNSQGAFVVSIRANDDSWISVTVDGAQTLQGTLIAPTERTIQARSLITIHAGNIGALRFSFNGKALAVQGDDGEAKTIVFDHNGLQPEPGAAPNPVSHPLP